VVSLASKLGIQIQGEVLRIGVTTTMWSGEGANMIEGDAIRWFEVPLRTYLVSGLPAPIRQSSNPAGDAT
jgi:hypothetical protein